MAELKQVKLNAEVKSELDSLKYYENDSYSNVVKRLIEDNRILKEDKLKLFEILLNTSDVEEPEKIIYNFISVVIGNTKATNEEKLQTLEIYLNRFIETDSKIILDVIDILKNSSEEKSSEVLVHFENYVKTSSWSSNFFSYWPFDRSYFSLHLKYNYLKIFVYCFFSPINLMKDSYNLRYTLSIPT